MPKPVQPTLFDVPASGDVVRPRRSSVLPPVDIAAIQDKWTQLPSRLQRVVPNPRLINDRRDFWLTPAQVGAICGGIGKDAVIERMYSGEAFPSCVDVGADPNQPYFRLLLEDALDFLLTHHVGADEI